MDAPRRRGGDRGGAATGPRRCRNLEKHVHVIREEFEAFVATERARAAFRPVSRRDQDLAGGPDKWRQCSVLEHCPRTAALLPDCVADAARRGLGQAIFSVLAPGTRLRPHCGPTNSRLTLHLGIIVPPACGALTAGGEARAWRDGEALVFDDSSRARVETRVAFKFVGTLSATGRSGPLPRHAANLKATRRG